MGYESKFYIVEKSDLHIGKNGKKWAKDIASFDIILNIKRSFLESKDFK